MFIAAKHQNTSWNEPDKLNNNESQNDTSDIDKTTANDCFYFGVASIYVVVVGGKWLGRFGLTIVRLFFDAHNSLAYRVDQLVIVLSVHDKVDTAGLGHVSPSVFGVLVPPRVLPVGVVVLATALELELDVVKVLGETGAVGLAVGLEHIVKQIFDVYTNVIAVEEEQDHSGYFDAEQKGHQRKVL